MENFNFKKFFKPRREFAQKTKETYLAAFSGKFQDIKPAATFHFNYALRGAGVFAALLLLLTGTSNYAYGKNVGPTSVLYPLKRVQENIRVFLAPAEKKSAFHLGLAEKRLNEVEILKTKNADSPQAAQLIKDMRLEVKKSFETLAPPQKTSLNPAPLPPMPSPTPSQPIEEKPQSSGATQPKRNANDVLPNESVKQLEVKSEPVKPAPSAKINPPVFGPPKNQPTESSGAIKKEPTITPTSSKPEIQATKIPPPPNSANQTKICKFVDGLIKNQSSRIKIEIANDPEIAQKFNANCDGIKSTE